MSATLHLAKSAEPRYPFALPLDKLARGPGVKSKWDLSTLPTSEMVTTPQVMLQLFSPEECRRIIAECESRPLQEGEVEQQRDNYRRANAAWILPSDATTWIYQRIASMVEKLNKWYHYDLYGFLEPLHFVRYDAGGKFDWHLDTGGDRTCTRKLSVTVQLSDPSDYVGGGLEFCPQGELHRGRYQGTAIVFPSMLAHRVTPIERGLRRAIVAWIHGPSFR